MKKSLSVLAFLLTTFAVMAQKQASGVVSLSDTGDPEPGVNVVVTGTTSGTITDLDGNFEVNVPDGKTITISYTGYKTVVLPAATGMNVVLEPENEMLEEVVATGYGVQKKSDVTGSISSVKSEALQKTPSSNVSQALQGRAAGVTVNAGSGQPGAGAEIRIRGIGSALSDNSPIYVVDGAITDNIAFLSSNDIASMEVLKDASATAIYGSRAANGVILITTKSGSKDRDAAVSFNAYWGIQNVHKKLDLMNARELAETKMRLGGANATDAMKVYYGGTDGQDLQAWWEFQSKYASNKYLPANYDYANSDTDWQDAIFKKNAFMHNYHLSIDGAADKFTYALSATYYQQQGTIIGSDYNRLTLRLNTSYEARKWLKIGEHLSFTTDGGRTAMNNSSSAEASVISAALAMAPWDPVQLPEGTVNAMGQSIAGNYSPATNFPNVVNPYSMVYMTDPNTHNNRWLGDLFVEIKPVKGLTIRPSVSMDLANNRNTTFKYKYRFSNNDGLITNTYSDSWSRYCTIINDNVITYANKIGKHDFSVMAGESNEQYKYLGLSGSASDFINEDPRLQMIKYTQFDSTKTSGDGIDLVRRMSFFGRVTYAYDSRYMATVNFRADASNKFNKDQMWGYFPSASLGWRMSEESWLKGSVVDQLKIRLGWGRVGNDRLGSASFSQTMEQGLWFWGYSFNGSTVNGAGVNNQANLKGKWETTEQWDAGVDFGLWGGLLGGSLDFYIRDTKDMLMNVKAPAQVGNLWDPVFNVGTGRNMGIDLELTHNNRVGDFEYSINANLSFLKNKLTALNGGSPMYPGYQIIDEGKPLFAFYGYEYLGIYRSDEEAAEAMWGEADKWHAGDAKFVDQNNDGIINDEDKVVLGTPYPWLTGGLNFEASYKGLDFQVFFQGVYGAQVYNALRERLEGTGDNCTLSSEMVHAYAYYSKNALTKMNKNGLGSYAEYFQDQNEDAYIPNPYGNSANKASSNRFMEDGSYLRLKNVTIGYTLPASITKKAKINRLRFYVTANNLFTITKYSGFDPEVGGGVDYGNYPQSRTFMFGVNLDF